MPRLLTWVESASLCFPSFLSVRTPTCILFLPFIHFCPKLCFVQIDCSHSISLPYVATFMDARKQWDFIGSRQQRLSAVMAACAVTTNALGDWSMAQPELIVYVEEPEVKHWEINWQMPNIHFRSSGNYFTFEPKGLCYFSNPRLSVLLSLMPLRHWEWCRLPRAPIPILFLDTTWYDLIISISSPTIPPKIFVLFTIICCSL